MKRRTVVVALATLLIAAAATLFYATRNEVAPASNSGAESRNEILTAADDTLAENKFDPNPLPAKPDDSRTTDVVAKKIDYGNAHSWPTNIEGLIWEYFAHRQKSNITSINSVQCTDTNCVVEFSGTDINPRYVDEFSELKNDMFSQHWNIQQGSIGTREIAPGVRVFVISISNVPVDMDQLGSGSEAAQQQQTDPEN